MACKCHVSFHAFQPSCSHCCSSVIYRGGGYPRVMGLRKATLGPQLLCGVIRKRAPAAGTSFQRALLHAVAGAQLAAQRVRGRRLWQAAAAAEARRRVHLCTGSCMSCLWELCMPVHVIHH